MNKQQIAAWIITRSVIVIFLIFYPWLYMIFFGLLLGVIYISSGIVPGIQEVVTITAYLAGSSVLIFSYPALFLFYLWRNSRKERKSSWFKLREGMTCRDFVHGNHASQNSITQDLRPVTTIQDSRGNELPLDSVLVPGACYQKITLRKKKGSRTVSEKVHQPFTLDAATRWKREEQERRRSHAVIVDEHQGRITCSCGQEYPLLTLHDRCLRCGRKLLETE